MKGKLLLPVLTAMAIIFSVLHISCKGNENKNNNGNNEQKEYINMHFTEDYLDLSAEEVVSGIRVGWNLGNTLDASGSETAWGNPRTTKANFDALANAGFNAARIPVTWSNATDREYNIRPDWMARVKEVVDYAVDNGMYVILNSHHDTAIFKLLDKDLEETKKAVQKIWEQIAIAFRDYDDKLILESFNEPRTPRSANEWIGGTNEERVNLNALNQLFVDTVRATGGNNSGRVLLVPTYAASPEAVAMGSLVVPNDSGNAKKKIAVSIHSYSPYDFALRQDGGTSNWNADNPSDTSPITSWIDRAYTLWISKGTPVIAGEMGAVDRGGNEDDRAAWIEFYVKYAKGKGIPCFIWDNGSFRGNGELFGFLDRRTNTFPYQKMLAALMRGTG